MKPTQRGILATAVAYVMWGLLPVFWKQVKDVSALEILSHRIVWAMVFNLIVLAVLRRWAWVRPTLRNGRTLRIFLLSSVFLSANWLTYIWAVNTGHVVESSLGYFILPLLNVGSGVLFFKERIRPGQWVAIAVATIGVIYLAFAQGGTLWISFVLAITFAIYGVLRKTAPLDSLEGLTIETAFCVLPSAIYLLYLEGNGMGKFGHVVGPTTLLLILAGAVTALPLLLFASGVRQIPLSTVGVLQYISPILQFMLGAFVYQEPFSPARWIGFAIVWLALIIYTSENLLQRRRAMAMQAA